MDNFSIIRGKHLFQMGANIRLYQHNDQRGQPGGANVTPSIDSSVFAQSCCMTVAPPSTQTVIQTGESGRVIRFALKIAW